MSEICYNSAKFLKGWFADFSSIQGKMAGMNHLTNTNTKKFSQQTLNELLMPNDPGFARRKDNLNIFCDRKLQLLVPDEAYNDMTKSFLWFLGYITGVTAEQRLYQLFYCVVRNFNPATFPNQSMPAEFPEITIINAFGNIPFDDNPGLKILHCVLTESLNISFYSDAALLRNVNAATTVESTVRTILC